MTKRWHETISELVDVATELREDQTYYRDKEGYDPDGPYPPSINEASVIVEKMKAGSPEGHWTKTPPTKPGDYWVADRDGALGSPKLVFRMADERLFFMFCGNPTPVDEAWKGWWWSEPIPVPPDPPKWED